RTRSTRPGVQISISISAFSVSTRPTIWPRTTTSPGFTYQARSVPDSMSAPSEGIAYSNTARHQVADRGDDLLRLGQGGLLEMTRVGDGHLGRADAQD